MDPMYELQAEICRTLAHPLRIAMLHLLAAGPREVNRIARELDISQPNASQHLSVMRAAGLVEAERDGREMLYRLADPDVMLACEQMARVMRRRLSRMADLAARLDGAPADAAASTGSRQEPVAPQSRSR
jgi:ArsR family transcriptional regulator, virulence genes transcriptional regulator